MSDGQSDLGSFFSQRHPDPEAKTEREEKPSPYELLAGHIEAIKPDLHLYFTSEQLKIAYDLARKMEHDAHERECKKQLLSTRKEQLLNIQEEIKTLEQELGNG